MDKKTLAMRELEKLNDNIVPKLQEIRNTIPEPALYEQLAEECVELAQACLKKARKLRDENFTPKTMDDIDDSIQEELTDVALCLRVLKRGYDPTILNDKVDRWIFRNSEIGRNVANDG